MNMPDGTKQRCATKTPHIVSVKPTSTQKEYVESVQVDSTV